MYNISPDKGDFIMGKIIIEDFQDRDYTFYNTVIKNMSVLNTLKFLNLKAYSKLTPKEFQKNVEDIFFYIFNDAELLNKMNQHVKRPKFYQIFDSNFVEVKDDFYDHMNPEDLSIILEEPKNSNDLYIRMHEYTHFQMLTEASYVENYSYSEFFPILIELIGAYYYSIKSGNTDFEKKVNERMLDIKQCACIMRKYLFMLKHRKFEDFSYSHQLDMKCINDYILGFVYANRILEIYRQDKCILDDVRDVLYGREKLECFMDEYYISISDYDTVKPTLKLAGCNF